LKCQDLSTKKGGEISWEEMIKHSSTMLQHDEFKAQEGRKNEGTGANSNIKLGMYRGGTGKRRGGLEGMVEIR